LNIRFDLAEQRHRANAEIIAFSRVCQRSANYSGGAAQTWR